MATKRAQSQARTPAQETSHYERIPVDDLYFDAKNPRLVEYLDDERVSQDELLRLLWQLMAVDELAMSIAASGYWGYEPFFVVKENGHEVVIEGNRRLAAVKLLLNKDARESLRATDLPKIDQAAKKKLRTIPVIRTTRKKVWQYLGFKHVNGPVKWDSFAKAEYVAKVHDNFEVSLEEIATQIGDTHKTTQRLYRAHMVIAQADRNNLFKKENRYKKHFSFSHLYTGLDYEGIASFIKLKDEVGDSKTPVPKAGMQRLGELFKWLYGDKELDLRPVVDTQNPHLRQLDEVLQSKKATDILRAGLPLSVALDVSKGDERLFRDALIQARENLQKARGTLSTGYRGETDLLDLAESIGELAYDLLDEMERKKERPRRRKSKKISSR